MIDQLLACLRSVDLRPTPEELAEALWLAQFLHGSRRLAKPPHSPPQPVKEAPSPRQSSSPPAEESQQASHASATSTEESERAKLVHPGGAVQGRLVRVPAAAALPHSRELGQAFRALRRRVPSRTRVVLDEEKTAYQIAETQGRLWSPVFVSTQTRWMDLALVVDGNASMALWDQTLVEFERLLEYLGAFRDVRRWTLETADPHRTRLYAGHWASAMRIERPMRELIDPAGRRLILVVSDCIAPAWHTGAVAQVMSEWGHAGPVALAQVLPQRLWVRTALGSAVRVSLRARSPGLPNVLLEPESRGRSRRAWQGRGLPMPTFPMERLSISAWARMLANGGVASQGLVLPPASWRATDGGDLRLNPKGESRSHAVSLLENFQGTASPLAQELASLLAAAPLTLPVMRLVQQVMLPEARQVHLAEVLLGGLLREVDAGKRSLSPDEVRYEFLPGVRESLLDSLTRSRALEVLRQVSDFIGARFGQGRDFAAVLVAPEGDVQLSVSGTSEPFATVAATVLRRLGGGYGRLAESLLRRWPERELPPPREVRQERARPVPAFAHSVSLSYKFFAPFDSIFASLVTSLAASQRFGPLRLWEDGAEFGRAGEDASGVRRVKEGIEGDLGYTRLDIYFDTGTPHATRELFVSFVDQHLRDASVELLDRLSITCVCGQVFAEDVIRERFLAGRTDIGCPVCDRRTRLPLGAEQGGERPPHQPQQVRALRTDIQALRSQSLTGTKVSMTEANAVKTAVDRPLRILHLSDLHLEADTDPFALIQPLDADLKDQYEGLGVDRLDYLVISGDLTQRAAPQEFEKAREFVSELIERFGLTSERCILVPGNHDLDWNTESYQWKKKSQVDATQLKPGTFIEESSGYLLRDEARYPERFRNFSQHFYHPLKQRPYPLLPEEQCLSSFFSDSRIQFLAMNSAWEIDEYFPGRSSIFEQALARGLESANRELAEARHRGDLENDAQVLRIAVWHHPITGNEKIQMDSLMTRLLQADVRVCLHGHVHEDRADLVNYLHPERRLHVIGAGSFGAPLHHRPESVPRLFNLLEFQRDLRRLRVHTRCLRKQGGAWEGWPVWPGERLGEKRTYYEVTLLE